VIASVTLTRYGNEIVWIVVGVIEVEMVDKADWVVDGRQHVRYSLTVAKPASIGAGAVVHKKDFSMARFHA
jgi:hypothetical protein